MRIVAENMKKRIGKKGIILTHDDADGLMAAVILQKLGVEGSRWGVVASANPTAQETDRMLELAKTEWEITQDDVVYVVDREMLTSEMQESLEKNKIVYIDHHMSNKNQSFGSNVRFIWDSLESAATLSLRYFEKYPEERGNIPEGEFKGIARIAEYVKLWDTFQWTDLDVSKEEERVLYEGAFGVSSIEKIFGKRYFYRIMIEDTVDSIEKKSKMAYEIFSQEYEEYKEDGSFYIHEFEYEGYKMRIYCGFDFKFQSLYSYELFKTTDLTVVMYANFDGTVSIRNRQGTDSTYLASELGRLNGFSGGGHKTATGCKIMSANKVKSFIVNRIIETIGKIPELNLEEK